MIPVERSAARLSGRSASSGLGIGGCHGVQHGVPWMCQMGDLFFSWYPGGNLGFHQISGWKIRISWGYSRIYNQLELVFRWQETETATRRMLPTLRNESFASLTNSQMQLEAVGAGRSSVRSQSRLRVWMGRACYHRSSWYNESKLI